MKWNESTTYAFVQEFIKHECLYNSKHFNYKNKPARDSAIVRNSILVTLDQKIKSIRSTYSQEMKKINESHKSGAGTDDAYIPTLKWFSIYHDVIKNKNLTPRKTHSNLTECVDTVMEKNDSLDSEFTTQEVPVSSRNSEAKETETIKKPMSRKRNIKCLENLVNKVKAVGEMIKTPMTNTHTEFDIFGKGVAAQLNAMPIKTALQAQCHIQNYLTSVRVEAMMHPENQQAFPSTPKTFAPSMRANSVSTTVTNNDLDSRISLDSCESNDEFAQSQLHDDIMDDNIVTIETIGNEHSYIKHE